LPCFDKRLGRIAFCIVVALFAAASSGCFLFRVASNPMERVSFRELGPERARGAVVLFPGFGDRPDAFKDHGFVAALEQAAPRFDVFGADAHFGYYRKRTLLDRLEQDVIGPLRARGYREIWLVGASMGGFGAVAYARSHPTLVRGVMLFAPYLGPKEVVQEVSVSGLCSYQPRIDHDQNEANFARRNFVWLRQQACETHDVSLWLAVGSEDRLRRPDSLLGGALSPSHVLVLPGGHGWKVWTPALQKLAPAALDTPGVHD
jgi:pimeloyl-ACP methyl ester carboxylesterase